MEEVGIPDLLQMDNQLAFRGSNRSPHSLGLVLRLCLLLGIQPMFIPQGEAWRNGEVKSFQGTFDKAFFRSQRFSFFKELCSEAPQLEHYHNEHHLYGCLKGKTPNQVL
jgi:putative transposase